MPRISNLPAETTPSNDDLLAMVDTGGAITAKITRGDLLKGSPLPADTVNMQAIQDEAVTNAKLKTGAGEPGGAWNDWTPSWTNVSGGTLNFAKYKQIGKTVHFYLKYTLAGAGVSGTPIFSVPVELNASYAVNLRDVLNGNAIFTDASASSYVPAVIVRASQTTVGLYNLNAASTYAVLHAPTSTTPFTWANGDTIYVSGTYEAA